MRSKMMINNPFSIDNIAPDLSRFETKSVNVIYRAQQTGYVVMYANPRWDGLALIRIANNEQMNAGTIMFLTGGSYYDNENESGAGNTLIKKGDYFRIEGPRIHWIMFIPCVGAK